MTRGPRIVGMFHVKHGPRPAIGGGFLIEKYDWPAARGGGIFEVWLILAGTERIEKMLTINYVNKPSKPVLLAAIRKALAAGHESIELVWGENQIVIDRGPLGLDGRGWIAKNGGQDLADSFKMSTAAAFAPDAVDRGPRMLSFIARDIRATWPKVYFGAVPYLQAMASLDSMSSRYGEDDARSIVAYFLANAGTWRGPDAQRIKAELKGML
jgi:hypothetical protein